MKGSEGGTQHREGESCHQVLPNNCLLPVDKRWAGVLPVKMPGAGGC